MAKKTDNHNLPAKLDLRRYFLHKYHTESPIHVLDCCQGSGVIWRNLREEFTLASYWGIDEKPRKGRLKLDSSRVLAQPGWPQNVVDIDTYGSPWRHWFAMLPNVCQPTTVFLTIGQIVRGTTGSLSKEAKEALGIKGIRSLPRSFDVKLAYLVVSYCLTTTCEKITIIEAVEAVSDNRNVRYVGVRLTPKEQAATGATATAEPHSPDKEVEHGNC